MTLFRFHRGGLDESMATCREVSGLADLRALLTASGYEQGELRIDPYRRDDRIGWNTYIVTINGAAVGFTNGPVVEAH